MKRYLAYYRNQEPFVVEAEGTAEDVRVHLERHLGCKEVMVSTCPKPLAKSADRKDWMIHRFYRNVLRG